MLGKPRKASLHSDLKLEVRERGFQAERRACAKALRRESPWYVDTTTETSAPLERGDPGVSGRRWV